MAQRMSDTLQLVVELAYSQLNGNDATMSDMLQLVDQVPRCLAAM
jgi:hypothetical protein